MAAVMDAKRVVLIGPTGAGKSRIGNAILKDKAFGVSSSAVSCTQEPSEHTRNVTLAGSSVTFELTVVDTPGMGDSSGQSSTMMDKIIEYMRTKTVNIIIIVCPHDRMSTGLKNSLNVLRECLDGFDDGSTALFINKAPSDETLSEDTQPRSQEDVLNEARNLIEKELNYKFANFLFIPKSTDAIRRVTETMLQVISQSTQIDSSKLKTWTERIQYYENITKDSVDTLSAFENRCKELETKKIRLLNDRKWHSDRIAGCIMGSIATCWIPYVNLGVGLGAGAVTLFSKSRIEDIDKEIGAIDNELERLQISGANKAEEVKFATEKLNYMRNIIK